MFLTFMDSYRQSYIFLKEAPVAFHTQQEEYDQPCNSIFIKMILTPFQNLKLESWNPQWQITNSHKFCLNRKASYRNSATVTRLSLFSFHRDIESVIPPPMHKKIVTVQLKLIKMRHSSNVSTFVQIHTFSSSVSLLTTRTRDNSLTIEYILLVLLEALSRLHNF